MLQVKDLCKEYRTGGLIQKALDHVSLNLRDNEFVAILGPSGSGKTTLLNIIGGLDRYDSGDVIINGISTKKYKDRDWDSYRNHTIGFVFQSYNLIPHQTVLANVELALTISGIGKAERRQRAIKALEEVGLGSQLHKKPNQMSGGQMQRVAIARALVTKPSIVLLDEPLCNLDVQLRIEMRTEMSYLFHKLKTTVFHVTHDPSEAFAMADRIIVMNGGKIDQADDPKTCYLKPRTALVAGLLGAGNDLKDISILETAENGACRIQVGEEQVEGTYFPAQEKAGGDIVSASEEKARPGQLRFRPEDGRWTGGQASGNCFKARAVLSSFEGGCYRVKMVTGNGQEFCIIHQEPIPEQTEGYVQVEKEKLYVYELAVD